MDRCDECGFTYDVTQAEGAAAAIGAGARELAAIFGDHAAEALRARPRRDVWSPLEYACHVRDVLLVQRERVLTARRVDRPSCEQMGRDERVEHDGYRDQAPADVARQVGDAARMFGNVLGRLDASSWERTLVYNYPARAERSLRWVAVHTAHEMRHHLGDVRRQLT
jgi:hypothetical protein